MLLSIGLPRTHMDRSKLKQLIVELKRIVGELESEIYSDTDTYLSYDEVAKCTPFLEDDDGYPD